MYDFYKANLEGYCYYYYYSFFEQNKRIVNQFHYVSWPDHAVPEDNRSLTVLRYLVNHSLKPRNLGPIIVHCRYLEVCQRYTGLGLIVPKIILFWKIQFGSKILFTFY